MNNGTRAMEQDAVLSLLREAREFLEDGRWDEVRRSNGRAAPDGKPPSHDMCRLSSAFLVAVLDEADPEGEWRMAGGSPDPDDGDRDPLLPAHGGYRDASGRWHAHYWVVRDSDGLVADITADQFGGGKTLLEEDPPTHGENYDGEAVESHRLDLRWRVSGWMSDWRTLRQSALPRP